MTDQRTPCDDEVYSIISDQAFLVAARTRCWKCRAAIRVVCLYCETGRIEGEAYEEFTVSNITAIDEALRRQLGTFPDFRFGRSATGEQCLLNHCPRCRASQADYYLHCEPSGRFFSLRDAPAGTLEITPLAGTVRLTGDEGFEP